MGVIQTTASVGGSDFKLSYGKLLGRISKWYGNKSERLLEKGNKLVITNPSSRFSDGFTLHLSFTVNNTKKYTLTLNGDYKGEFKEARTKENALREAERLRLSHEIESSDNWDGKPSIVEITIGQFNVLSNEKMFMIIVSKRNRWFLKG